MCNKKQSNRFYSREIVDFIVKCGIKHICISPGSRNTPLTESFINHKKIKCFSIFDERASCFYALGLAKTSSSPVAVLTTSGTAIANLFPAIIEAKLSSIPLLILTADRPACLVKTGESQTINQNNLYGEYVNEMINVEFQKESINSILSKLSKAISQLYSSNNKSAGPVHINFRIDEPLYDNLGKKLTKHPKYKKPSIKLSSKIKLGTFKKPLIVCGPLSLSCKTKYISELSRRINAPIIADILSQMRNNKNSLCYYEHYIDKVNPDIVIRFGDKPTSKKLNQFLNNHKKNSYLINESLKENDDCPNIIIQKFEKIKTKIGLKGPEDSLWTNKITNYDRKVSKIISLAISSHNTQANLIRQLIPKFNNKDHVFIGNSTLIRVFDQFSGLFKPSLKLLGNHVTRGIDGLVSTALGMSYININKKNFLFIGDLSLFYDANGFHILRNKGINLTIIVINNKGGQIFSQLPYAKKNITKFKEYWTTPPSTSIKKLSELFKLKYYKMQTIQLVKDMNKISNYNGVKIIEVSINHLSDMKFLEQVKKKINKDLHLQK